MKKTVPIVLAALAASLLGCATPRPPVPLRGADVSASDKAPPIKLYSEKVPGVGEARLVARTFLGQPPVVPHTIEAYVPLTLEDNACMECHQTELIRGQKIPQIGQSHFSKTARTRDGKPALEMSRFQCDSCHVPQVDAPELIHSQFVGASG